MEGGREREGGEGGGRESNDEKGERGKFIYILPFCGGRV